MNDFLEEFIALLDKYMPYFLNSHKPMKIELPAAVYRDIINKLNKRELWKIGK